MSDYKLGVIGAGNMAEAILKGVVSSGCLAGNEILAFDPDPVRRESLEHDPGIHFAQTIATPASCPQILLAVKPFIATEVLKDIEPYIQEDAIIISIAAGLNSNAIDEHLKGKGRIVRVMPNTPMLVGKGASGISAGPRATEEDINGTKELLESSSITAVVEEEMMDIVTGLSGSGPAYFFYMVEAMVTAGIEEGLDPETARSLAVQTCYGAGQLLSETGKDPKTLREQVTTPNGTTQRGIETMDAANVKASITAAVKAAAERSRELGK